MPSDELLYTESHEWVRQEADGLRIGITKHAVDELQDLVYLDLKSEGTELDRGDPIGEVESVKAIADIYAPVSGTILEVNASIADDLDTLYDDPFDQGWLILLEPSDEEELDELMNEDEYRSHIAHE